MKSHESMRALACAEAVRHGARILNINGYDKVCYCLSKDQLESIFGREGFVTSRVSWLNMITQWRYKGEVLPPDFIIKDKERNDWSVVFQATLGDAERMDLFKFAKEHGIEDKMVIG